MATFLSTHRVPGLDDETMAETASDILEGTYATFVESFIDFVDGFLVSIWEATDQGAVEKELQRLGFPFVELHQVHLRQTRADLESGSKS